MKKIVKSCTAFLLAFVMAFAFPLQMMYAASTIPSKYVGLYYTSRNSDFIIIIKQGGVDMTFRGEYATYGRIAAGTPDAISFNTLGTPESENLKVNFTVYSIYNRSTKAYERQNGDVLFLAHCNPETPIIRVRYDPSDFSLVDRYIME